MNKTAITLIMVLAATSLGAQSFVKTSNSTLSKGLANELSSAKKAEKAAVMVQLLATDHRNYGKVSAALKSDVLDNEKLTSFLKERNVQIVTLDNWKEVREGKFVNRLFWNTGNMAGVILVDLNGKTLNKLTAPEILSKEMTAEDIIKIYSDLLHGRQGPKKSK
jgi:hypothetical protein|tara:strand:+ start:1037 stop:1528 length:492 start_codon:yes stop_codon:yes gene_type:complete